MIKRIMRIWFIIAVYELGKFIGREVYYKFTSYDSVKVPKDFYEKNDQIDIENYIRKDDEF